MTPRVVAAITVLALLAGRAPSQRGIGPLGPEVLQKLLQQYDKNKDGKIQKDEYPRTAEAFANLDRDRNGVLDAADFEAGPARGRRDPRGPEDKDKLPQVGSQAPDFELPLLGKEGKEGRTVKLSSLRGKQPVALIFGSYT
jgi:hypothetical protein